MNKIYRASDTATFYGKIKQGRKLRRGGGVAIFKRNFREDITRRVIFKQRTRRR